MSSTLQDVLAKRFDKEPPEFAVIKDYVQKELGAQVAVALRGNQLIISVSSAALAGALRTHLYKLKNLCKTDKRLVIRIG